MAESKKSMKAEVVEKVAALMTVAFGLIAALAWNSAIQALVVSVLGTASQLTGLFVYAIIVTIIAVVATVYIAKVSEKLK